MKKSTTSNVQNPSYTSDAFLYVNATKPGSRAVGVISFLLGTVLSGSRRLLISTSFLSLVLSLGRGRRLLAFLGLL